MIAADSLKSHDTFGVIAIDSLKSDDTFGVIANDSISMIVAHFAVLILYVEFQFHFVACCLYPHVLLACFTVLRQVFVATSRSICM